MSVLKFLTELDDVEGAFVVDEQGGLVSASMPPIYDHGYCSRMGGQALRLLDSLAVEMPGISEIVLRMSLLHVVLRRIGSNLLVVLIQPGTRITSLRVAMNVVTGKFDAIHERNVLQGKSMEAFQEKAVAPPDRESPVAPVSNPQPPPVVRKVVVKKPKPSSSGGIWG